MKAFFAIAISLLCTSLSNKSLAQKPVKAVISVPGAQDEPCKIRIENYLSREYGIVSAIVNYHRRTVTVKYLPDRTNIENVKTAIANCGYDADDVKANPESYSRLPIDHRHPIPKPQTTDGGTVSHEQ